MSTSKWTGAVTNDWFDPNNWNPAGVPDQNSDVTIAKGEALATASIRTVNSITDSSHLLFEAAGTNTVTTFLDNTGTGRLRVDDNNLAGGTILNIGGTLTNAGHFVVGNRSLSAPDTVTAAALDSTGSLNLLGSSTNQALLNVSNSAGFGTAGVLTGNVHLGGDTAIEFASGQINTIATGAELILNGANAFVEDSTALGSNSAPAGLAEIANGTLALLRGAAVSTTGDLTNGGTIDLLLGGDSLSVAGTLTNTGGIFVKNLSGGRHDSVAASSFVNSGTVDLFGDLNTSLKATLNVSGETTNNGAIIIASDKEELAGPVDGTGSFTLDVAKLQFDSSVSAGQTIYYGGSDNKLTLKQAQNFHGTIHGFKHRDWIDAANFLLSGTTLNFVENSGGAGGTLTLTDSTDNLTANIHMTGSFSNSSFALAPDHGTGTLVKFV
jgi:hypothetical protein